MPTEKHYRLVDAFNKLVSDSKYRLSELIDPNVWNQVRQLVRPDPVSDYVSGGGQSVVNGFNNITSPQWWGQVGSALSNIPQGLEQEYPIDPATGMLTPEAQSKIREQSYNLALNWNPAAMAVTAFHGSPYLFDKFQMSKVGTGEGAQAYGHGLYFAENPGVAKYYAEQLGQFGWKSPEIAAKYDPQTLEVLQKELRHRTPEEIMALNKQYAEIPQKTVMGDMYNALSSGDAGFKGSMYKVDIPDSAVSQMLDWDKPLSQQADSVKTLLKAGGINPSGRLLSKGSDLLKEIQMDGTLKNSGFPATDQGASDFLKSLGIPGIKYLDQGSRGRTTWIAQHPQGGINEFPNQSTAEAFVTRNPEYKLIPPEQTHNYVVFDENLPKILERK